MHRKLPSFRLLHAIIDPIVRDCIIDSVLWYVSSVAIYPTNIYWATAMCQALLTHEWLNEVPLPRKSFFFSCFPVAEERH